MKLLPIMLLFTLLLTDACGAQTRKPSNSKRATKVDSISAPPRMDGNTGQYDTVRHPMKHNRNSRSNKQRTDYEYRINSDTIHASPKTNP